MWRPVMVDTLIVGACFGFLRAMRRYTIRMASPPPGAHTIVLFMLAFAPGCPLLHSPLLRAARERCNPAWVYWGVLVNAAALPSGLTSVGPSITARFVAIISAHGVYCAAAARDVRCVGTGTALAGDLRGSLSYAKPAAVAAASYGNHAARHPCSAHAPGLARGRVGNALAGRWCRIAAACSRRQTLGRAAFASHRAESARWNRCVRAHAGSAWAWATTAHHHAALQRGARPAVRVTTRRAISYLPRHILY